jgi:Domain of unknown function (DUF3854)
MDQDATGGAQRQGGHDGGEGMPGLLPHHRDLLHASAISDEVIRGRGYQSVRRPSAGDSSPREMLKRLAIPGWARSDDARYPGLLMPLYRPTGEIAGWQYRPDNPPKDPKTGKVRKYASQVGRPSVVDVHPLSHDAIIDPRVPLWITEGVKKADALRSRGQCAVALPGVWNWRSAHGTLGDWEDICLKGRDVRVCYDADILTNMMVRKAAQRLSAWLKSKGARPALVYPPELDGEQHKGVDDFLAAGGDLDLLMDTAGVPLPPLTRAPVQHGCPYRETAAGIVWDRPTTGGPVETQLTNFTARITAHTVIDDGSGEERHEYGITARVAGGPERTFSVPAAQFGSMNWASKLGPEAIVNAGMSVRDHARAAVQRLSGAVPERRVYSHTGWRKLADGHGYLSASGAMMAGGLDTSVTVEIGPLAGYSLPDVPGLPELRQAICASVAILEIAPDQVTVPLLGAVYRAPVPLPADCSAWLHGQSGTFKTSLCALGQQHFGESMGEGALPGNWTSTANNLEMQAFQLDGVVFVVDDYSPEVSRFEAQKRAAAADRLLRGAANHSARGRLRADGTMRPPKPARAQVLTSAEDLPPAGVSLRARVMICEVAPGAVSVPRLTAAQSSADDGTLALAMAGYVRDLAFQLDGQPGLRERLKARLGELRDFARAHGHPRSALNIASMALGWDQFVLYAERTGAVTAAQRELLWQRAWKALCDLGADQARYSRDADPVAVYLRALGSLIAAGRAHLAGPHGDVPAAPERWGWTWEARGEHSAYQHNGERIGWADSDDVYLDPEGSYKAARQFADASGSPLGLSKHALHKLLAERGLLASRSDPGHFTAKRDLDGKVGRRVLHLTAHSFESADL